MHRHMPITPRACGIGSRRRRGHPARASADGLEAQPSDPEEAGGAGDLVCGDDVSAVLPNSLWRSD